MSQLYIDQSDWSCIRITGSDRVRFLQGLCTADVAKLGEGDWIKSAMLNVKGRVISIIDIINDADCFSVFCEPVLGEKTKAFFEKYAIVDDVSFVMAEQPMYRILNENEDLWLAKPIEGECPDPKASIADIEWHRIKAGILNYGIDVTEDNFPFESRLQECIDYSKGCYIGQEPIARVHARGQATKQIMGLCRKTKPFVSQQTVHDQDNKVVGTITSTARSSHGDMIALASLHRSVAHDGSTVMVDGETAQVTQLPWS